MNEIINSMNQKEIAPLIVVTKNPFRNIKKTLEFFEKSIEDNFINIPEWHHFMSGYEIDSYRTEFANSLEIKEDSQEKIIFSEIIDIGKNVLNSYVEKFKDDPIWENSIEKIEKNTKQWNNARFNVFMHSGTLFDKKNPPYMLGYHLDSRTDSDGLEQHIVTSMFYLNDDYECGQIEFIYKDESSKEFSVLSYKPSQGDVITFPSFYPYYHAVRAPYAKNRYSIRISYNNYFDKIIELNKIKFREFFSGDSSKIITNKLSGKDLWRYDND